MKTRRVQISGYILNYIEFLEGLYCSGAISERTFESLAIHELKNLDREERLALHPLTLEIARIALSQYKSGRKKISIWRNQCGERYLAAEFV